ncbi:MAG: hypothetical protein ACT4RN_05590 [Pseudonocardia sp.]
MAPTPHRVLRRAGHTGVRIPAQRGQEIPVQEGPQDGDSPISVTSLLRREGMRVPHAADRPLQPRAHQLRPVAAGSWLDGVAARRAGVAAGALVAAASVFGAAVLTDTTGRPDDPVPATPGGPGSTDGRVGTLPGLALLGPIVPGSDVALGGPVALAAFQTPGAAPTPFLVPGGLPGGFPGSPDTSGGGTLPGGDPGAVPVTTPGGRGPATQVVGSVTAPVTDLTDGAAKVLPRPLGGVVEGAGDVVDDAGGAVGGVVDDVAGPLAGPVRKTTKPVTDTVEKVAAPVTGLLGGGDDDDHQERSSSDHDDDREPAMTKVGGNGKGGGLLGTVGRTAAGLLGG